jgi:phosphate-selective porin OprO/OprP
MLLMGFNRLAREGMRFYLPTLTHFANVLNRLVLVLALVLPVALSAGEAVTEQADPDRVEPCEPAFDPEPGEAASNQAVPREPCEQPSQEQTEEARQEITTEIAEGTQTAVSLESLLLGRNYVFFGRVELDAAAYFGDIPSSENGGELRRLRVGIAGLATFFDSVSYKFELDLTDGTNNWSDIYVQWDLPKRGTLRVGNQTVSQNLSAMTSSLSHLFMEEPLPVSAFSLSRRLAVSYDHDWRRFGVHGMFFTRDPNNDSGKYGWAARVFTKPIRGPEKIGHVGISTVHERMDREARYRTRPESHVTDIHLVDTGLYDNVQYQHVLGLEMAGGLGSNTMKLELFRSRWERERGRSNTFKGAYVELGHFLTGQQFNYVRGKFVRPIMEPGTHAWEIGLRASWLDLNDRDVRGGEQVNIGAALNYYRRPDLRFQLNLLHFRTDAVAGNDRGWILQAKMQFNR